MRILLLGKWGQLGWELQRTLAPLGEVTAMDYPEIDLVNERQVREVVRSNRPHVIVNATAYTAVDKAESESETAMAINARAPGILAEEASRLGAASIHYSPIMSLMARRAASTWKAIAPTPWGFTFRISSYDM